jgi:23S rRNA (guanine745-N1)-methyltransferase
VDHSRTALACPVCHDPLIVGPAVATCEKNHTFDRAREGYFNLLLANQKGSSDPGDDRDAVAARREFLTGGHYNFLAEAIGRIVSETAPYVILDAGCGEGFYLNRLARAFPETDCYGFDISRSAMRLASRSYGDCTWAVANIARRLPLATGSCDLVISVMAPRNTDEFKRITRDSGRLIVVIPSDGHLRQLTDRLMSQPSDQSSKPDELSQSLTSAFDLVSTESIQHNFLADRETIRKLVTMTPLRWKSNHKSLEDLDQIDNLEITAAFRVLRYASTK